VATVRNFEVMANKLKVDIICRHASLKETTRTMVTKMTAAAVGEVVRWWWWWWWWWGRVLTQLDPVGASLNNCSGPTV